MKRGRVWPDVQVDGDGGERGGDEVPTFGCSRFIFEKLSGTLYSTNLFYLREDNPNLYYWAEITGQHPHTFST